MIRLPSSCILAWFCLASAFAQEAPPDPALDQSVEQLRHVVGRWDVVTEFLDEEGNVTRRADGAYEFETIVPDRVVGGRSKIPDLGQGTGLLFYIRESSREIEMVSVSADGRLWIMTGPLGGEQRVTKPFETASGGTGQLRFTRFNVEEDRFESRMEWTDDGGETWKPGNRQVFIRASSKGDSTAGPDASRP